MKFITTLFFYTQLSNFSIAATPNLEGKWIVMPSASSENSCFSVPALHLSNQIKGTAQLYADIDLKNQMITHGVTFYTSEDCTGRPELIEGSQDAENRTDHFKITKVTEESGTVLLEIVNNRSTPPLSEGDFTKAQISFSEQNKSTLRVLISEAMIIHNGESTPATARELDENYFRTIFLKRSEL